MKIFLDTSSLVKLYHEEGDTAIIDGIFEEFDVKAVFLSELTKIEFASTFLKKVRMKQISEINAKEILDVFESDLKNYTFIPTDQNIVESAKSLIAKYGVNGLRTLDSLQLSTAIYLKNSAGLFITSDKLLDSFFEQELLQTLK